MQSLFSFRAEYREYTIDCIKANEQPCSFRSWFETAYHYEMADQIPTGQPFDGTFTNFIQSAK